MNLRDLLADKLGYYEEPWTNRSFRSLYNERNLPENANDYAKQQELGTQEHAAFARELMGKETPLPIRAAVTAGLPLFIPAYDASKAMARSEYTLPVLRDIAMGLTGKGRVEPGLDSMAAGYKGWRTGLADMLRGR